MAAPVSMDLRRRVVDAVEREGMSHRARAVRPLEYLDFRGGAALGRANRPLLSSHKSKAVRAGIEAAGAQLRFLPQYSPGLNPIEQVFAKLKVLLHRAAPRTREALWKQLGKLLDCLHPDECRNYITAAGYRGPT